TIARAWSSLSEARSPSSVGAITASPLVAALTSAAQITSASGSTATWALPVGHPPVNRETLALPGSSSAAHATARSRGERRPEWAGPGAGGAGRAVAAGEGLGQPDMGGAKGHLTWPPPPVRACR